MEGFNFFFGFYGLLLGFSVATVTRALAGIIGRRRREEGTALLFLLGLFMLLDLISLWVFAWDTREHLGVNYPSLYGAMAIAIVYYFGAVLAFPESGPDGPAPIEAYWANKRLVLAAIIFASGSTLLQWLYLDPYILSQWQWWLIQLTYWAPLAALIFTRSRRVDTALWGLLVLGFVAEAAVQMVDFKGA